jgi:hypothetical protein
MKLRRPRRQKPAIGGDRCAANRRSERRPQHRPDRRQRGTEIGIGPLGIGPLGETALFALPVACLVEILSAHRRAGGVRRRPSVNSTVNSSHTPRPRRSTACAAFQPTAICPTASAAAGGTGDPRRLEYEHEPAAQHLAGAGRRTGHADGTAVSPDPSDLVVLICPAGAESAPISHGDRNWPAYPETPGDPHSRWLVGVRGT